MMITKLMKSAISLALVLVMLLTLLPLTVLAYFEEPSAEGNEELETSVRNYTKPVGVTMQRLTGNCKTETDNLGDDFLFVIKSADRYYAMREMPYDADGYEAIPAVDVTDWINDDGSLTVPAETLGVAFLRYEQPTVYELGTFINGTQNYLRYSESYTSRDGDDDDRNDAERTYTAKFMVETYEDGEYIVSEPYYWSENEVSGTLHFNGSWEQKISSYHYQTHRYSMIVDLRDNGAGEKEFYFRYLGTDVEYVGDEVEGYLYYADCRHQFTVRHAEYDAPTCMLKGCEEYWYCEGCNVYFKDAAFRSRFGQQMPIIPATGHDWGSEKCANCDRPVPVYSKVTNQAQFDALADDTMFVLVAEYGGKYYVPDFSEIYAYMTDSDGDGFYDIHDIDENENDIPDYLEFDEGGEEGVYDYLEWDMDGDGDVDEDDLLEFHCMICDQHLTDMLYNNGSVNVTEVTMNADGTLSHAQAKKTAEFEMVDVYLAEEYGELPEDWEMPYYTKCIKQFAIPNYFISAPSMRPIERMYRQRIYDFGDSSSWGVIFYDDRNDYYYFENGDLEGETISPLPFLDICQPGSVSVFDTFDDIMWILYDEGQLAQIRLRDYEGGIGFVSGHAWELDGWEWIEPTEPDGEGYYDTHDTQACVYLYASAPYETHTCEFGDWYDSEDGKHRRDCTDPACDEFEAEAHGFGGWSKLDDSKHQRECDKCDAAELVNHSFSSWTKFDGEYHTRACSAVGCTATEKARHSFGDWGEYAGFTGITRHCSAESCDAYETKPDEPAHVCAFGVWTPDPSNAMKHIRKCACGASESEDHTFGEWVKKDDMLHTHSCQTCGAAEDFEHSFNDWIAKDNIDHIHQCMECEHNTVLSHDYERVVTKEPTVSESGEVTYTCSLCSHSYTEMLPKRISEVSNQESTTTLTVPSGSNAYIPEGTVFDVVELPEEEVPNKVLGDIELKSEGSAKPLACYDLSLLLDGAEIQPNGNVKITLPALQQEFSYDSVVVVYIAPDGSYEECKTTVNADGTISFETNHFSKYALVGITATEGGIPVGAVVGAVIGAVIILSVGSLAIFWFVIKKKRFSDLVAFFKKGEKSKELLHGEAGKTDALREITQDSEKQEQTEESADSEKQNE